MQKLDRLGWVEGFSFDAYGARVGVRSNNVAILDELRSLLPIGWRSISNQPVEAIFSLKIGGEGNRPGLKQYHLLYNNITQIARTLNLDGVLNAFEDAVQLQVAETARHRIFVHAGVVGWKGHAIIIPGLSLSGKSTLVRELVKAGATYYSDDYALLDAKGRVHPYPIPIGVRTNPQEKQERYPIATFGGTTGTKPLPIGLVLVTEYKKGTRWRPKLIPAGQGLLAVLANTVSAHHSPAKALATLQQVVLKASILKGVRGETDEVVEALLNRPWHKL